jgi:hypothetical protein
VNYGKTSERSAVWHRIRPDDPDDPSYCGLGMLTPQRWAVRSDTLPDGDLLCLNCSRVTLDMASPAF